MTTETTLISIGGVIVAIVGAVISSFFYGRRVQGKEDIGTANSKALEVINSAIEKHEQRAREDADHLKGLPDAYPNDTDDLQFRMPGGPTSRSRHS